MKRFLGFVMTGLALTIGLAFSAPTAAFAHDEVSSTAPVADSEIAPGIVKVSVTFGEDIMDIPPHQGLGIRVAFPGGSSQTLECIDVNGVELAGAINATETGTYTVDWRSVSSDGHENSGTFNFKVAEGAAAGEAPDAKSTCLAELNALYTPEATTTELDLTKAPKQADGGSKLDPIVGLGIGVGLFVVLSVLGAFAAELQKRRRARKEELKKLKAEVEANPDMLRDL